MFDLIVRNASLPDGRTGIDVAVRGERIEALEPHAVLAGATRIGAVAGTHQLLHGFGFILEGVQRFAALGIGLCAAAKNGLKMHKAKNRFLSN